MREEIRDMDAIRASTLIEGYDFTNREVVSGLFKVALNYLPKGASLDGLFLDLERESLDQVKSFFSEESAKENVPKEKSVDLVV